MDGSGVLWVWSSQGAGKQGAFPAEKLRTVSFKNQPAFHQHVLAVLHDDASDKPLYLWGGLLLPTPPSVGMPLGHSGSLSGPPNWRAC